MRLLLSFILLIVIQTSYAQNAAKKVLGHEELVSWNNLVQEQISPDGRWVTYELKPEEGDTKLVIHDAQNGRDFTFDRSEKAQISANNQYIVFKTKPFRDSLLAMRRRKVDKDDLPKDTLTIFNVNTRDVQHLPNVKSFKMPEKWSGHLAVLFEKSELEMSADSTAVKEKKSRKKPKKENKENGHRLVIYDLNQQTETEIPYVTEYTFSKKGNSFLVASTGNDSTFLAGVYHFNTEKNQLKPFFRSEGEFKNLTLSESGDQLAFLANFDTTDLQIPPHELFYARVKDGAAMRIADNEDRFLPTDYLISKNGQIEFSEDGSMLYFGIAPQPILQDTSLLDEEIVNVEVWNYQDKRLHTQQESNLDRDKKQTYRVVYHPKDDKFIQLNSPEISELRLGDKKNADWALVYDEKPYQRQSSWEGFPLGKDVYLVNTNTGKKKQIAKNIAGSPRFSPEADFVMWYSNPDTAWYAYDIERAATKQLTTNKLGMFYDELNDRPMYPYSYNSAGWTKDDKRVWVYDRYDIWELDPRGVETPKRLTQGRENKLTYRWVDTNEEEEFIDSKRPQLLHIFDHVSKGGGYANLSAKDGTVTDLLRDDNFSFERRPAFAQASDAVIFKKENFQTFGDLNYTNRNFSTSPRKISTANPQQSEYAWGSIELYEWTSLDGQKVTGMLAKPANFDPEKKYPMLVNFYERSSDRLHRHPRPAPGRSTINYAFYTSRGYLIFNPDVPYRVGYPGESAFNAVTSGVTSLIDKGFVDKAKIGIQGHSWGGYQIAHIITKTDMFACAESGAPVVNMFSAYGGIRWRSGLSRMFQYEHTQSRIGGTIWDKPLRYLENSPIFFLDKVNTPVLILHNDKDGAVPWYQGIEMFVGLRRLGKPAWMLNYNGEPHWPVKLQNRKDFNVRMQQFFDYYLMDAEMPKWMEEGVPAVEKGINQRLELMESGE
ncbi:MAG: prolyl oligopeptidase family serine peptidase [Saprospiraceae bacterium]